VKRSALVLMKLAVSLALLGYLFSTTDMGALARRLRQGDTLLLGVAMVFYVAMLALSAWRWHVLLQAQGSPAPLRELSASYLVATFFNNFLPSNIGGDLIRVRDSSRFTGSTTASLAVVAVDRILGFVALYSVALAAYVAGTGTTRGLLGATPLLAGLGVVFAGLAYLFFRPGTARNLMKLTRLNHKSWARERFETVQAAVHAYRNALPAVMAAYLGSVMLQVLLVGFYYAIAHALDIALPLSVCLLMVPLCTLIQAVPISFNGWGIRETVFIVYFTQVGLSRDSALAFSLVGAGFIVLLSLSGAVVWTSRGRRGETIASPV